jgi:large subunit ribosomal protein L22
MSITVKNSNIGISPRKVRLVCDLVRNKKVSEAVKILRYCEKREIALVVSKLINSALAIATDSNKLDIDNLVVGSVFVNEGAMLKRIMPRAQGRAYKVRKRTSHLTITLKEI